MKRFSSVDEILEDMDREWERRPLWQRVYLSVKWATYRYYNNIEYFIRGIRWFIQRGKRGWGVNDTWNFDHYLTRVIAEGVAYLRLTKMGYPTTVKNSEEWNKILKKIETTFLYARLISEAELYYIPSHKWTSKEYYETNERFNNGKHGKMRCMRYDESKSYEEGWRLFQRYFFNLWD